MSIREPKISRALSTVVERMLALDPHAGHGSEAADMLRQVAKDRRRAPADWPDPPKFVGRDDEVDRCFDASDPATKNSW